MLAYDLARRRAEVGQQLAQHAPRAVVVHGDTGDRSTLSTLVLAQLLPGLASTGARPPGTFLRDGSSAPSDDADGDDGGLLDPDVLLRDPRPPRQA